MDAEPQVAPPESTSLPRPIAGLVLLIALALALHGAGFWLLRATDASNEEYRAAARHLRSEHRSGDLVFFVPAYATRAREWLGDLDVLAVAEPLAEDLEARERVWLFALDGAEADVAARFREAGHELGSTERFGSLTVQRWSLGGPRASVRWRAQESLRSARVVHRHPDGREEACARWEGTPLGGKWVCPKDSAWLYVGPELHRMGETVRRCLWAHPPREGQLVVRYPGVPLSGTLAGRAGHTLNASTRAKASVFLGVTVEGSREQRFEIELKDTWRPWRMLTPPTGTATVSFAISSPDNGANHFCFSADAREVRR